MSYYDLHFNKDDVYFRNVIIGLLATLYDSIIWYNQTGRDVDEKLEIRVPFYFSTTGTERYLQDNFLNNIDFDPGLLEAETFYNKIPRGIVDLSGISIETSAIVNKYVRMNRLKQEPDGSLNTYSYETYMVPVILNVDCTVYTDSILDQLKCSETVIKTFYKNKQYQVDIAYTRIPCLIQFPDEMNNERTLEFSFTDKREFKTSFPLQIKSHIPIFRPETELFAGNTMQNFASTTHVPPFAVGGTDSLTYNTPGAEHPTYGATSTGGTGEAATGQTGPEDTANAGRLVRNYFPIPNEDGLPWPQPSDSQGPYHS